jgi:EAL domain-containing protein (putative c-di-GMP-specific phosphodiesterase class I)
VVVLFDQAPERGGITQTIEKIRDAIREPVELNDQNFQVTCSMGLASYPNDGADAETLLMNADAAMYRAKEMGRNNYQLYTSEINIKVHEKLRLQEQLRHALANEEFRLVYQPQVDLQTEKIFGVEALLRWDHPTEGLVSPTTFIPLAEETGLIVPIGDWVLHTACHQNKAWQDAGIAPMTISVNVSARQFLQKDWVARVAHALAVSGLDAQYLELELTESLIMQDLDGAIGIMTQLQAMGVRLSIDDFGTGYSSLSALKHFPIVRLKIDQSFVRELPDGEDNRAIARAVISLGRQLNLKVIAEGVETEQQLDFLRDNDCHEIQGYHYSKPVTPSELEQLLREPFAWPSEGADEYALASS